MRRPTKLTWCWSVLICAVACGGVVGGLRAQEPTEDRVGETAEKAAEKAGEPEPSVWMKHKLTNAQAILNGMATEDYDLIVSKADSLLRLNKIEAFARQRPEGYRLQLRAFQFAVSNIKRNAEKANLDGVAFAFNQMTASCIHCHRELRK